MSQTRTAIFGLVGVAINILLVWNLFLPGATTGRNDFLSFYAGGALAGSPDLYDPAKVSEVQLRATGLTGDSQQFARLPCFAIFLKPLTWFPYGTAYILWELLSGMALLAAVALWPGSSKTKWLTACWMLPLFIGLFNGQDDPFVLFWIALSVRLLHRRWPMAAGLVLALAISKYHLIAMIPIVILAQKRWRVLAGSVTGVAVLLAISFAVAGPDWPRRYIDLMTNPRWIADLGHMPTLYANFQYMRFGREFEILTVIALAAVVFRISRIDGTFERPIDLALAGGLLVTLHGWLADCTLLLPALTLSGKSQGPYTRFPSVALVTPLPWFALQLAEPIPALTRILILWLVLGGLAHSEFLARQRLPADRAAAAR